MKSALLMALLILAGTRVLADIDYTCEAKLTEVDGSERKAIVERRDLEMLGKNLIVGFEAPYYDGGPEVQATFMIRDKNNKDGDQFFGSSIGKDWEWSFDAKTPYGPVTVHCQ